MDHQIKIRNHKKWNFLILEGKLAKSSYKLHDKNYHHLWLDKIIY